MTLFDHLLPRRVAAAVLAIMLLATAVVTAPPAADAVAAYTNTQIRSFDTGFPLQAGSASEGWNATVSEDLGDPDSLFSLHGLSAFDQSVFMACDGDATQCLSYSDIIAEMEAAGAWGIGAIVSKAQNGRVLSSDLASSNHNVSFDKGVNIRNNLWMIKKDAEMGASQIINFATRQLLTADETNNVTATDGVLHGTLWNVVYDCDLVPTGCEADGSYETFRQFQAPDSDLVLSANPDTPGLPATVRPNDDTATTAFREVRLTEFYKSLDPSCTALYAIECDGYQAMMERANDLGGSRIFALQSADDQMDRYLTARYLKSDFDVIVRSGLNLTNRLWVERFNEDLGADQVVNFVTGRVLTRADDGSISTTRSNGSETSWVDATCFFFGDSCHDAQPRDPDAVSGQPYAHFR